MCKSKMYFVRYGKMYSGIPAAAKLLKASPADIRNVCVPLHSDSSEPITFSPQTMPDEHLLTSPPSRWPTLITLPTLAKFQLFWRCLCDVMLFPSCRTKSGLTDAPLSIEFRFQVTRLAPSTLQLRSRGRPSLPPPCLASSRPSSISPPSQRFGSSCKASNWCVIFV